MKRKYLCGLLVVAACSGTTSRPVATDADRRACAAVEVLRDRLVDYDRASDSGASEDALSSGQQAYYELFRQLQNANDSSLRSVSGDVFRQPDTFDDAVELVEGICIDLGVLSG